MLLLKGHISKKSSPEITKCARKHAKQAFLELPWAEAMLKARMSKDEFLKCWEDEVDHGVCVDLMRIFYPSCAPGENDWLPVELSGGCARARVRRASHVTHM